MKSQDSYVGKGKNQLYLHYKSLEDMRSGSTKYLWTGDRMWEVQTNRGKLSEKQVES